MGLLDETVSVPRRTMTLFFLIDTSGSMEGNKIGAVNDAVVNVLPMLNDISETNPDAEIKVAALEFSSGVNWLYDEPKLAKDFIWQDVTAGGLTSLGGACAELAAKLSRNGGFMQSASGSFAPAIILLSDGGPTDNYEVGLAKRCTETVYWQLRGSDYSSQYRCSETDYPRGSCYLFSDW